MHFHKEMAKNLGFRCKNAVFVLVTFEKMGGSLRVFDVIMPKYKIQIYIYGFSSGAIELFGTKGVHVIEVFWIQL